MIVSKLLNLSVLQFIYLKKYGESRNNFIGLLSRSNDMINVNHLEHSKCSVSGAIVIVEIPKSIEHVLGREKFQKHVLL